MYILRKKNEAGLSTRKNNEMCQGRSSVFCQDDRHLICRVFSLWELWLQKGGWGVKDFQAKGPAYMTSLLLRMAQHSTMLKIIPMICREEEGSLISASG